MLQDPMSWVEDHRLLLDRQEERLSRSLTLRLGKERGSLGRLAAGLDALSPLKVLGRGYAIAQGPKGVVKSVAHVSPGDELRLRVSDGEIPCEVK
jgi:exodeoxyribonuclease VII large subunit